MIENSRPQCAHLPRGRRSSLLQGLLALCAMSLCGTALATQAQPADLILHNGKVWTLDDRRPVAQAIAIRGRHIAKVGTDRDVLALRGADSKVIDLRGKLVLPGFNDAHTHFENATLWFFQVRLDGVNEQREFTERLREAAQRVPPGYWITGGEWGPAAGGAAGSARAEALLRPDLAAVDAVTPEHPVLLRSTRGAWFANSLALRYARIDKNAPNPRGGSYERDARTGEFTGMLEGRAGEIVAAMLPPVTLEQKLVAARAVQRQMNGYGITSIADIARIDDMSQRQTYHTHVERSYSDVRIFEWLKARGELSLRVYAMLPLDVWREVAAAGLLPGSGDELLRYGGLKGFADNTLMLEPFADKPGYAGGWSFRVRDEQLLRKRIVSAHQAGFDLGVHALGDRAVRFVLDAYQAARAGDEGAHGGGPGAAATAGQAHGVRTDPRLRLIHAWYATPEDLQRIGAMGLIVDITPSHLTHEWRKAQSAVGPERARTAHAWRTMLKAGAILNIVSDMPGGYTRGNLSPFDPLENIYYAVTRQDLAGEPAGGWHPEQRLTVKEAIRAYTLNPAYASREDHIKGSLVAGKLADVVVLSRDILTIPARELLSTEVLLTVLGGEIVFQKP